MIPATPHFRNRQDYKRDYEESDERVFVNSTTFYDGEDTEVRVTVALPFSRDDYYGEGYAFLSKDDAYDHSIGRQIAYIRALRDALYDAEIHIVSHVRTIAEVIEEERSAAYPAYHFDDRGEGAEHPDPEWDEPTEAPAEDSRGHLGGWPWRGPLDDFISAYSYAMETPPELYR